MHRTGRAAKGHAQCACGQRRKRYTAHLKHLYFGPSADGKPPQLIVAIKIGEWDLLARGNLCCAPRAIVRNAPVGGTREPRVYNPPLTLQPGCIHGWFPLIETRTGVQHAHALF